MFPISSILCLVIICFTSTVYSQRNGSRNASILLEVEGGNCTIDCYALGYCEVFQRCEAANAIVDNNTEDTFGKWVNFKCPGGLVWNPDSTAGGSCDFFENLVVEIREQLKQDTNCWPVCGNIEHENITSKCEGFYWLLSRKNESQRELEPPQLLRCPKGLVFNKGLETCTKCEDIVGQTKTDCCPPRGGRKINGRPNQGRSSIVKSNQGQMIQKPSNEEPSHQGPSTNQGLSIQVPSTKKPLNQEPSSNIGLSIQGRTSQALPTKEILNQTPSNQRTSHQEQSNEGRSSLGPLDQGSSNQEPSSQGIRSGHGSSNQEPSKQKPSNQRRTNQGRSSQQRLYQGRSSQGGSIHGKWSQHNSKRQTLKSGNKPGANRENSGPRYKV